MAGAGSRAGPLPDRGQRQPPLLRVCAPLIRVLDRSEHRARSRGQRAPGAGRVVVAANTRCLHRCADNSIDQGWVTWRQEWSGWATIPCGVLMMVQVRMFRPSQPRSCCWK